MTPAEAAPDQANNNSSDRLVTPGQLNTSRASVSGRGQPTPTSSSFHTHGSSHGRNVSHGQKPNQACDDSARASLDDGGVGSQRHKHWDRALALDLVSHCLASGIATWPGQLTTLPQLCQLAVEASHALEVTGHPVMALEALQVAQMCCKRLVDHESSSTESSQGSAQSAKSSSQSSTAMTGQMPQHQQQQQVLTLWQDRLVTACLMRCLVDATAPLPPLDPLLIPTAPLNPKDAQHFISQRWTLHRNRTLPPASLPKPDQWKKLAQQQLKVLSDAGVQVNTDKAIARLQSVHDSLLPTHLAETEEPVGAGTGGVGLFRSISGMSAMSTPRRDSTLSRSASLLSYSTACHHLSSMCPQACMGNVTNPAGTLGHCLPKTGAACTPVTIKYCQTVCWLDAGCLLPRLVLS